MGNEIGKKSRNHNAKSNISKLTNFNRLECEASPWSIIFSCPLNTWNQYASAKVGFNDSCFECPNQLGSDCGPTFCGYKFSKKFCDKIHPHVDIRSYKHDGYHLKRTTHYFEYNHMPAHLSSINHTRVIDILAISSCYQLVLLRLHQAGSLSTRLGLLDITMAKFLGNIGGNLPLELRKDLNNALIGDFSPDVTICAIGWPKTQSRTGLHIYSVATRQLLFELDGTTHCSFAFNPYHKSRYLSTVGYNAPCGLQIHSFVDKTLQVVASSPYSGTLNHFGHLILHSRDGRFIFKMCLIGSCTCRQIGSVRSSICLIQVFSSDSAVKLTEVEFMRHRLCYLHDCTTNYRPVISACGRRLAFIVDVPNNRSNEGGTRSPVRSQRFKPKQVVVVCKLPSPLQLTAICRSVILKRVAFDNLSQLPVPLPIINYLQFSPI